MCGIPWLITEEPKSKSSQGGTIMTQSQKNTIESLRAEGLTYDKIASALNVSLSTVKMYFSRKQNSIPRCDQCHRRLNVTNRKARFCSPSCRCKWHQNHLADSPNREKYFRYCQVCGKMFFSVKAASFCSRPCYYQSRRKVAAVHEQ